MALPQAGQKGTTSLFLPMMLIMGLWFLYLSSTAPKPQADDQKKADQGDTGAAQESPKTEGPAADTPDLLDNREPHAPDLLDETPALDGPEKPADTPPESTPEPPQAAPESPVPASEGAPAPDDAPLSSPDGRAGPEKAPAARSFHQQWQDELQTRYPRQGAEDAARFTVSTKDLRLVFTRRGAGVFRAYLLGRFFKTAEDRARYAKFEGTVPDQARLDLLRPYLWEADQHLMSLGVRFDPEKSLDLARNFPLQHELWESDGADTAVTLEGKAYRRVTFTYRFTQELTLIKQVDVPAEGYRIQVRLALENTDPKRGLKNPFALEVVGPAGMHNEDTSRPGYKAVYMDLEEGERSDLAVSSIGDEGGVQSFDFERAPWGGAVSNYFAAIMRPDKTQKDKWRRLTLRRIAVEDDPRPPLPRTGDQAAKVELVMTGYTCQLSVPAAGAQGKAQSSLRYELFLGPKSEEALVDADLTALKEYIWAGTVVTVWFTDAFAPVLRWIHDFCGNWGLAVILLTILVRLAILPVSLWQQKHMMIHAENMKRLKPKIDELQKKFKDDRMKLAQEQRALMEREGVGMLPKGCLTIFLQMPIFIGLIGVFYSTLDFRHSDFIWWINDLSNPDVLAGPSKSLYFFPLTFLGNPQTGVALSVLPIIYVALMVLQQKLQPVATDDQQRQMQRMMGCMFVAFGLIFYNFPAGPLLYFNASMGWSLVEQLTIRKQLRKRFETQQTASGKKSGGTFKA